MKGAGTHCGRSGVGVVATEGERAGAGLGESAGAADDTGEGRVAGGVGGEGEAVAEGEVAGTGDGSDGHGIADGECAGVHRGGTGVGIGAQNQSPAARLGDVSGAGDTVTAMFSLCISSGVDIKKALKLCNIAGSIACSLVGAVSVSLDEITGSKYFGSNP